nr:unnamed protein product [Digitaria exilis]
MGLSVRIREPVVAIAEPRLPVHLYAAVDFFSVEWCRGAYHGKAHVAWLAERASSARHRWDDVVSSFPPLPNPKTPDMELIVPLDITIPSD